MTGGAMEPREAAVAYLAVDVENGCKITGLTREDAESVAEFARVALGCDAVVRPAGPVWRKARAYTVAS